MAHAVRHAREWKPRKWEDNGKTHILTRFYLLLLGLRIYPCYSHWKCYCHDESVMSKQWHMHTHTHTHAQKPREEQGNETSPLVSEDQGLFGHLHWGCLFSQWCLKRQQSNDGTCSDACTGTRNPAHRAGKPVWTAKKKEEKRRRKKMMKKEEEKCKHKKSYNRNGIQTFSRPRHSSHIAFKETQPRQEGNYS